MMKLIYLVFFSLFLFNSYACNIKLYEKIVLMNSNPSILVRGKNVSRECSANNLNLINQVITSIEGKVNSHQIVQMLLPKGINLSIVPETIHLQKIKSLIREQLSLPANIQIESVTSKNGDEFWALDEGDLLSIKCKECVFAKNQSFKVEITKKNHKKKNHEINVDFIKLTRAYRVRSFQKAFSQISKELVQEDFIENIPHTKMISSLENIKFYKTNKPLTPGTILKTSDLMPIDIVKAGNITDVILENELVKIKTSGISRRNGSFGEIVEVFHPKRKKSYHGTVIDKDKIKVSL